MVAVISSRKVGRRNGYCHAPLRIVSAAVRSDEAQLSKLAFDNDLIRICVQVGLCAPRNQNFNGLQRVQAVLSFAIETRSSAAR